MRKESNFAYRRSNGLKQSFYNRKDKKFFFYASICYTLLYSIVIMGIMVMTYAKLKANSEVLLEVKQDWDQHFPIIDIRAFNAYPNRTRPGEGGPHSNVSSTDYTVNSPFCPPGYEIIVQNTWKGTATGCNCLGVHDQSVRVKDNIFKGSCTYNETVEGCKKVDPLP